MKTLQTRVNLVPLISKADMLTPKEIKKFKRKILDEIAKNQIRIYQVLFNFFLKVIKKLFYRKKMIIKFQRKI